MKYADKQKGWESARVRFPRGGAMESSAGKGGSDFNGQGPALEDRP